MQSHDIQEYLKNFNIADCDDINCGDIITVMYNAIINQFKIEIQQEDLQIFQEYQTRLYDLIENLRTLDAQDIINIIEYIDDNHVLLSDVILMMWCTPRAGKYLSQKIYDNVYRKNIQDYNKKITDIIENRVVRQFCLETLSQNRHVPIHCIDYIWFYMYKCIINIKCYNWHCRQYMGIKPVNIEFDDVIELDLGFNIEFIFDMELGKKIYHHDHGNKKSFQEYLWNVINDPENLKSAIQENAINYISQIKSLARNYSDNINLEIKKILDI